MHSLPEGSKFNISSFGSKFRSLFNKGSQLSSDRTLEMSKVEIESMQANIGDPDINTPLEDIFKAGKSQFKQIYLVLGS